jgi:hypothetical protein
MRTLAFARTLALPAFAIGLLAAGYMLVVSPAGAAIRLRGALGMTGGEDPSVAGTADPTFLSAGDARLTAQGELHVSLDFLDASRFPAGTLAEVSVGTLHTSVPLVPFEPASAGETDNPLGATTNLDLHGIGTARAGDRAEIHIRSDLVANGVRQHHETAWQGTLQ